MVLTARPRRVANGAAIRALREATGWKLTALAAAAGVSQPYLSNIEAGRKQATPHVLRKLADALCVPLAAITTAHVDSDPETD